MGLAYIGRVIEVSAIDGADFIESLTIMAGLGGTWRGTARKREFQIGDLCEVYLPDAVLPKVPEFSFMEKHNWIVRMRKFKGVPSECLIMPLTISGKIGDDISAIREVTKFEKSVPFELSGVILGQFPTHLIPKTDELNFQTVPEMRSALVGHGCTMTTKYDGSSQSFYHRDGHIGGCSRNWELRDKGKAAVWGIAHRYNLLESLPKIGNIALQWEAVGPKIQKNPLKLARVEPRVFDVFDIDAQRYLDYSDAADVALALGLPFVETHFIALFRDFSDDELRKMAEGTYGESGRQREGIVIRPVKETRVGGERISFKVMNLRYGEG